MIDKNKKNWAIRFGTTLFLYPIALILLFEEWGWEPLAALFAKLAKLPIWEKGERKITTLPPWSVVFVFGVPVIALLPVKFLAIYFFGKGHLLIGTLLLLSTKIFGTAICARLFQLTKPALLQIKWFAYWYPRWKKWKDRIYEIVRGSQFWLTMQKVKFKIKSWWTKIHFPNH